MTLVDTTRPIPQKPGDGRQLRVITDLVTFKATTADTAGAYMLVELQTPPGGGCPLHVQRYDDTTYLVLEGTYQFHVDGDTTELSPGGCAIVPRGITRGFANTGAIAARMLVIASPGGVWERFLAEVGDEADRSPWDSDMARVLAVAPKYGIAFHLPPTGDNSGGVPG